MLTGEVGPGDSVAVFGCGGVGCAAIAGARLAGAARIIAVDLRPEALEVARHAGADAVIPAAGLSGEALRRFAKHLKIAEDRVLHPRVGTA